VYNEHATSFCSKYVATKSCELLPIMLAYHTQTVTSACSCLIYPISKPIACQDHE
jgi:hypothetical protein